MVTLFEETQGVMDELGYSPKDIVIVHIGNSEYGCTWEEFSSLADFSYSRGFGAAEVATDLVIIFNDGAYLSRGEYDGSEWWDFHQTPAIPNSPKPIRTLGGDKTHLWNTIADMNGD